MLQKAPVPPSAVSIPSAEELAPVESAQTPPVETQEASHIGVEASSMNLYKSEEVQQALRHELVHRGGDVENRDEAFASFNYEAGAGAIAFRGATTSLGITLGAMVVSLGIIVCSGHPVNDAYIPMGLVAGTSGVILYFDKRKKPLS